jgi:hypothetical protein
MPRTELPHSAPHPSRRTGGARRRIAAAVAGVTAAFLAATAVPAEAATPGGIYTGLGNCPVTAPAMTNSTNQQVGCVVAVTNAGNFTIGSTTVPLTSPITLQFGTYLSSTATPVSFPDGSTANQYATVAPTGAPLLTAQAAQITIPGIINFLPGITSIFAQVQQAGPVTAFTPLATGENYPVFKLPVKLHLSNILFGDDCYIGSDSSPIMLSPTTGTTSSSTPMTGNPGTLSLNGDPNGYSAFTASFTNAKLVDNTFTVPGATGCGLGGSLDWIIDLAMGLPAGAGKGSVTFDQTNTTLALDTSLSDLTSALNASAAH